MQLEDSDAVPVVPQLLLQLRNCLLQRHNLLLPLLVLMQPEGDLICAAKHVRALLSLQLRQRGHQPAHPILHHLFHDKTVRTSRPAVAQRCQKDLVIYNLTTASGSLAVTGIFTLANQ